MLVPLSSHIGNKRTLHATRKTGIMAKPIFNVVLHDGDLWTVEAEWPDGTIEQVETFKAYFDALHWMNAQSDAWLRERA
jgi:hypothetical protein